MVPEIVTDLRCAGLSVDRIATLMGVDPRTVNTWQEGVSKPTPYARRRLDELHAHLDAWTRP